MPASFDQAVDEAFDIIIDTLEASEAAPDCEINEGILTISFDDGQKIILNRHAPNQEIWLAARTGGQHFRCQGGHWRDTRSGEDLADALSRVCAALGAGTLSFLCKRLRPGQRIAL
jgi:iron donor protein CyaY